MSRADDEVPVFLPLGDYEPPESPVVHVVQRLRERVRRIVGRDRDHVVEDERLKRATRATIDDFTASPDCSLLSRELDKTLGDWADASAEEPSDHLRLVVIPPGDVRGLLESWAGRHGHALLESPARDALTARTTVGLPDLDGEGVLVVPRLEHWFLRHRHGLDLVRKLLAAIAEGERRCVIGCNSWAWSFLRRAAGAELLLPEPITFTPFDAERLRVWFSELASAERTRDATFRESGSAADVLARGEDGELESDYLAGIAARSFGIPWVAWQIWQRSLRTLRVDAESEDDAAAGAGKEDDVPDDEHTLWLVRPEELVLPLGHEHTANLVLHALLMHGSLDVEELARVLPVVGESSLVPALVRSGHVERVDARYRCVPSAYPDIVERLSTAGVPIPAI